MSKKLFSFRWTDLFSILGGALILTYPALWNRFPIITSDSGTYILTALSDVIAFDRPVFYGYFIYWTDIYESLWLVVFTQNLLLSLMIRKTMKKFSPNFSFTGFFFVIITLTALTTAAWFSCQIMTDVFTPLLLLSLSLLLIDRTMGIAEMIFLLLVFFFSCLVHYSHFMLATTVVAAIALFKIIRRVHYFDQVPARRIIFTSCTIVLAIVLVPVHNYWKEGSFYFSKGSAILFTSKLVENGLLKKYLDAHCNDDPGPLCAFKDRLPEWGAPFLYGDQSPIHIIGIDKAQAECNRINQRIALSYPLPLLLMSLKGAAINLLRIDAGSGIQPYDQNSAPYYPIKMEDPTEFNQWMTSRQQGNQLHFQLLSIVQRIFIYGTLLILLFNLFNKNLVAGWNGSLISFARFLLLALIINALITGALASEHDDRYQTRIAWLVPFVVLMQYQGVIVTGLTAYFQRWNRS
jgi:hypothetical protein